MPYYPPSLPEEANAVDAYVFGGYRDDQTGVILTLDRALGLFELFRLSSRAYELIYISSTPFGPPSEEVALKEFGFDVAGPGGDFYSVVYDFPKSKPLYPFLSRLNDAGLFSDAESAEQFLMEYRSKSNGHAPLAVYNVWQVIE